MNAVIFSGARIPFSLSLSLFPPFFSPLIVLFLAETALKIERRDRVVETEADGRTEAGRGLLACLVLVLAGCRLDA